jgi:outer membrane protein OmpA-like peptidoglycan-associated protein
MPALAKFLLGLLGVVALTWLWLGPMGNGGAPDDSGASPVAEASAEETIDNTAEEAGEANAAANAHVTAAPSGACVDALNAAIASDRIQFRSGSPYLNPDARRLLDRIAEAAGECPGVRIDIAGYTSASCREGVNMEMSAFRATTVRDALVERGVPETMLTTRGRGAADPIGGNPADPANRRVEFTVSATGQGDAS